MYSTLVDCPIRPPLLADPFRCCSWYWTGSRIFVSCGKLHSILRPDARLPPPKLVKSPPPVRWTGLCVCVCFMVVVVVVDSHKTTSASRAVIWVRELVSKVWWVIMSWKSSKLTYYGFHQTRGQTATLPHFRSRRQMRSRRLLLPCFCVNSYYLAI